MTYYTVYEAANLIGVNPETVRRWIRSGELAATLSSKKNGYAINQTDLLAIRSNRVHALNAVLKTEIQETEIQETQKMIEFHETMLEHYKRHLKDLEGQ